MNREHEFMSSSCRRLIHALQLRRIFTRADNNPATCPKSHGMPRSFHLVIYSMQSEISMPRLARGLFGIRADVRGETDRAGVL
jgi:hypothetical protein